MLRAAQLQKHHWIESYPHSFFLAKNNSALVKGANFNRE